MRPRHLHVCPPCGPYSTLLQISKDRCDPELRKRKRTEADVLLHFAIQLCQEQMKMGGTFSLEHPVQDESWENSELQHLMDAAGVEAVVFYQSLV